MSNLFFEKPILNSPYECPTQHWELDETGQPTGKILDHRRLADFFMPIPKPRRRKGRNANQISIEFSDNEGLSTDSQEIPGE